MANSIVVVGSCMMDFVCYTSTLPCPGETLHGYKFVTNFGGKGANQCVAAHKLGGNTTMIARVGDDIWGDKYICNFMDIGINHKYVKKTPNYTNGIAQISVSDSGENQIIIVAGANSQLSLNDINDAKDIIEKAAVIICQLETSPSVAIEAMKLCKGLSILNGAPALDTYDLQLITIPSIFCVNESEATIFSKMSVATIDDAKAAIQYFLEIGCQCIIITMGAQGAVFATKEDHVPIHVQSPKIEAVDTTGAGDAFIGCLAHLLANYKSLSLKRAIEIACFTAAESCRHSGTQCSFPNADFFNEHIAAEFML